VEAMRADDAGRGDAGGGKRGRAEEGGIGAGGGGRRWRGRRPEAALARTAARGDDGDLGSLPASSALLARENPKSRSVEPTEDEGLPFIPPAFSPGRWLKPGLKGGL
jgi:hypothetical protein